MGRNRSIWLLFIGLLVSTAVVLWSLRPVTGPRPIAADSFSPTTSLPTWSADPQPPTGILPGDSMGVSPALAFWTIGNQPQTVIILHGGPGATHDYLRPEWDALSTSAQVVYYDQRGSGKSGLSNCYDWPHHVQDLHRLVLATAPNKPVVLAGSSWGTTLALLYTLTYPHQVKGLILSGTYEWPGWGLESPVCNPFLPPQQQEAQQAALASTALVARIREHTPDTSTRTGYVEKTVLLNRGRTWSETSSSTRYAPDYTRLHEISVPVLLFNGDRQAVSGLPDWGQEYARVLPQATLTTIAGASHDPWLANPTAFFGRCTEFLNALQ